MDQAKKVKTFDLAGKENGFLIELSKVKDLTTSYLSCCFPGSFKGFHLHKVRSANYLCIKGKITVITYNLQGREEVELSAENLNRLHIPTFTPTGLSNQGTEEAWIINFPSPAYDPSLSGEQLDYSENECQRGIYRTDEYLKHWGLTWDK